MEDHETSYSEGEQQISPLVFLEEEEERGEEEEEESEEEEEEREEEEEERQEEEEEEKEDAAGQLPGVEEHWEEYELEEELAGGGKMENKDTSEDVGDQSDSSMQSSEHGLGNVGNIQPLKSADKIRISASQRNLQLLDDMIWEKELVVQKTSDTLSACRLRSRMLAKQLDHVDMEIEREEEAGNVAAVSRLQALSSRLCTELEREKELELRIALTLKQNLVEMWQIKTKQGKYDILREQLQKDEEELQMQYQEEREMRIWKEKITALQAEGRRRTQEKREEEAQRECEERNKKILEDAKRNHEKAVCFLRQSMARIHEKNAKEEVKAQEHMERRIQAVLSLKTSITSNRERLQTLQILNKAKALEAKKEEMKMKEAILAEGGNVIREIFLHKRQQEHEKKKEAFRELQKSRKMEIVSRILQEKASIHKQKKSQSPTKAIKVRGKLEGPLLQRREAWQSEETCKHADGEISQSWRSPSLCSLAGERTAPQGESSENRPQDVLWESDDEDTERDQTLLVPEFPGLWSQQYDLHKVPKAEDPTRLAIRAMRKRMAEKKMEELQTGILHKPTVPGRGHKGCAFHSKPSCIHFKDFDVGQIYRKKIVLTNASYSVNYCRLVGISECLKDFISVHFDPPGKVSSGMSCEFLVTFKPMINEGLEGEVMFMAQTGPFSVPLKCAVKTCILALDKELIDFGSLVVGETISQTISLTNSGALGTRFKVQTSAGATSTLRATVKSAPARVVTQHSSACDPEEESSKSPVAAGDQNKDCAAQEPKSSSAMEQLGQGELNTRSDLDTDNADNLVELSPKEIPVEIMLGKVTEGEIGPFSSVKIPVLFVPAVPGDVRAEFVIVFDNPDCKPLNFSAIGVSVDVPIWVPQPSVDLRICLYERLYQDSVEVRSRATTTLRLKFEVCRELRKHMELLPKTGYIQAQSSFSAQLKFLPRQSLPEDAGSYFNAETGILEVPVTILLVDKFVEVQPNDGFGIILPLESLTLDIIFKATKAKEYSFELTCRTEINRQFKLSCKAVGVHPPLELSHSLVQFAATALNSMSSATLNVINSHVDGNPLTHPVPRIGSGDPVPVGPTSFEFHVPRDCPVTITPSVGTVLPGQKSSIRVSFSPALSDQQIGEEAARRLSAAAVPEAGVQSPLGKKKKDAKKEQNKSSVSIPGGKAGSRKSLTAVNSPKEPKPEELKPDSDSYRAAQASLMRSFRGSFNKYIIPCFVASGHATGEEGSGNLTCSPHNTLYLELHCPAVAPPVLITSDTGNNMANFGDIAVGQRMMKRITIENISPGKLELGFSVLNPNGPFLLVRAVGMLEPGESKPLIISFCPREDKWFLETLDIQVAKTNLSLRLSGHGVMPSTVCSVGEVLDMGFVMARDTVTSTVKIENTSTLTLPFSVQLESLSPARDRDRQKIPSFLTSSVQRTEIVGTQNYNGFSVFSVSPTGGKIEAGESQDFVVTFSPDHESLYYSDCLKVLLFGKQTAHEIQLKGAARDHPMFVEGGVPLDVPVESLAVTSPVASQKALERGPQEAVKSLLLLLEYVEGSAEPARAELTVGAMQSPLLAAKKAVEFSLDNAPELQRAGFALDGPKGALERGQLRRIGVSWVPPADLQTSDPPLVSALLTVKGDITESYRVLFMARVVSASAATD
ncbi:cilia- and flagella-associated protein 74 isoform X4 [Corvus cornix cornix]|uniref:cilia- and flagella-associated protein 74 isoform X4 n=1 Tax=Corvus cornix cornix TaxID=932674 RepID=UPI00194F4138|nr:cilia- and flagella-associated protein 74 isoform X4 [Corvus cornix cornix]